MYKLLTRAVIVATLFVVSVSAHAKWKTIDTWYVDGPTSVDRQTHKTETTWTSERITTQYVDGDGNTVEKVEDKMYRWRITPVKTTILKYKYVKQQRCRWGRCGRIRSLRWGKPISTVEVTEEKKGGYNHTKLISETIIAYAQVEEAVEEEEVVEEVAEVVEETPVVEEVVEETPVVEETTETPEPIQSEKKSLEKIIIPKDKLNFFDQNLTSFENEVLRSNIKSITNERKGKKSTIKKAEKNLKNIMRLFMYPIKIILEDKLKLHSATIKLLKKTLGSV